MGGSVATAFIR